MSEDKKILKKVTVYLTQEAYTEAVQAAKEEKTTVSALSSGILSFHYLTKMEDV